MGSPLIPRDNGSYNNINYWNKRYESDETYDWLVEYSAFSHIIRKYVQKTDSILMLGCGNSLLSEQMFDDGYRNIHNIDYSESVISLMSLHCDKCSQMKWSVMDCCELSFDSSSFDVVIEKATIDALLTEEKSPWHISHATKTRVSLVLSEVCRVLKPLKGRFISISFFGPHFRVPLYTSYSDSVPKLSVSSVDELGSSFHYYCYQLVKSLEPNPVNAFVYEPPKVIPCLNNGVDETIEDNAEDNKEQVDYLFKINV